MAKCFRENIVKASALGETGIIVSNITLFAVLVYELFGPMCTKLALLKAGEIQPEGKTSSRGKIHFPHFNRHADHTDEAK